MTAIPTLGSYLMGAWHKGAAEGARVAVDASYGTPVAYVSSVGLDIPEVLHYARSHVGPKLRMLTFHERAKMLKVLAQYLLARKEAYYDLSSKTGATRADSWIDIEGGISTLFAYASLGRRDLPNETFLPEGSVIPLSRDDSFSARHLLTSKRGVALHINAYNFPIWGMLEKLAPTLLAGVPAVIKPASATAFVTERMVRDIVEADIFPRGSVQLVCGGLTGAFEALSEQDVVTFTGSASTGQKLKSHPNITAKSIPFQMEADSLNCAILGQAVTPDDEEFALFIAEVVKEMTVKAGQKCTAIRRVIVPEARVAEVSAALHERLSQVKVGDPTHEGVTMGPLVSAAQRDDVAASVAELKRNCDLLFSLEDAPLGGDADLGGFFTPTLLHCADPLHAEAPHSVEAFGPVSTLMPYKTLEEAVTLAHLGQGSLVGSVVTRDPDEVRELVLGAASSHGRLLVLNRHNAQSSTGHGSPLPQLVHGGPGRAGGGEELGGVLAVKHYMQRTAVQADPTTLMHISREFVTGARVTHDPVHPFRKTFDELAIGDSLSTHRRTITEADIVNFACLSGDHFYAHLDEQAAKASLFGKRVAHGYLVLAVSAGLFIDPGVGPVLANYGLEGLRFVEPVGIGDTIQAHLTVKQKIKKDKRPDEAKATGVVAWDVRVTNQEDKPAALYTILTLVERAEAAGPY